MVATRVKPDLGIAAPSGQEAFHKQPGTECLCREWFPSAKQCYCEVPLPVAVARQSSMPELKGKAQGERHVASQAKHARNRLMMRELGQIGLTGLPMYKSMRNSRLREKLLQARSLGDLQALRSAIRAARSHLGMEDPLVKLVGKVLSEAERCIRTCRDCLALSGLQALPAAMSKIEPILFRVKEMGLGSAVWEDPYLGSARRKVTAWREHRVALENMSAKLQEGALSYCNAWAQLALENSSGLTTEFGCVVTKELVSFPDAGAELARALARMLGQLPGAPEDRMDRSTATLMRISCMLSQLERGQLDELLLKPGSKCGSSLQVAAVQDDILPFCALYQTLTAEVIEIPRDFQLQLDGDLQSTPRLSQQLAARIGELLQTDPGHLCLRILLAGGLTLRLLVAAGQPAAQDAQQVLGTGVTVQTWRRLNTRREELATWQKAGDIVGAFYNTQKQCCTTREAAEMANVTAVEAAARREEAEAHAGEVESRAADAEARYSEAKRIQEEAWQRFVVLMEETRTKIRRASQVEVELAKTKDQTAEQEHEAAKRFTARAEAEAAEAAAAHELAKKALEEATASADAAQEASVLAAAEAAGAISRYQEILHTPLTSSSPQKVKPSSRSRSQSATQRHRIKGLARPRVKWPAV